MFLAKLWFALGIAGLFMIIVVIQGIFRPEYDPWHQAISALSLGPGGWIQSMNFLVFGVAILTTVPNWRRILVSGPAASAYPVLTAISGLSFVAAGFVQQDPAPGYDPEGLRLHAHTIRGIAHLAIAGVAAASSVAGLLVFSQRFRGDPHWKGWCVNSWIMAALMIGCVAVYAVWSRQESGFAGVFERLAVIIPTVWMFTLVRRLWIGAPFMIVKPLPQSKTGSTGNSQPLGSAAQSSEHSNYPGET